MFFGDSPQIGEIQFPFHNSWQDLKGVLFLQEMGS
jgi:hypothetical protein